MSAMKFLIGVDIQDLRKFRRIINRGGDKFLGKVFTEREIGYCYRFRDPVPHLAARFSAKEALIKALKPMLVGRSFDWNEVEVVSSSGKPIFNFSERLKKIFKELGVREVELSLSHSGNYAVAVVFIHRNAEPGGP
ncbi:MAG: holo-ACP synthase [Nitrososphaerota archaeon]|nr:holo-ACP synthase [Nitrososphaerota archaeon]